MATEKTDVYNLGLIHIGHTKRVTSPTEKTTERRNCEAVYDPYRKALLTMAKWGFGTVSQTLTLTGNTPTGYDYEYVYPTGCLKALEIARASAQLPKIPFKAGSIIDSDGDHQRVIWTNKEDASLIFIYDVEDVKMFTPLFNLTLAHYMGVTLSRLMAKSTKTPTEMFQLAQYYYNQAIISGEVEAEDFELPEPDWITDR